MAPCHQYTWRSPPLPTSGSPGLASISSASSALPSFCLSLQTGLGEGTCPHSREGGNACLLEASGDYIWIILLIQRQCLQMADRGDSHASLCLPLDCHSESEHPWAGLAWGSLPSSQASLDCIQEMLNINLLRTRAFPLPGRTQLIYAGCRR